MQDIKIQINFENETINLNGSTPLIDFKKYIDKLKIEDAYMIQKNVRKQLNSYLKMIPKQEKTNLEPPIISDPETKEKINWKSEALKWKQEAKHWENRFLIEKAAREKLQIEFNEFKVEVRSLIIELKQEINILKQKVDYYDKKYNNEYDRVHNKNGYDKER